MSRGKLGWTKSEYIELVNSGGKVPLGAVEAWHTGLTADDIGSLTEVGAANYDRLSAVLKQREQAQSAGRPDAAITNPNTKEDQMTRASVLPPDEATIDHDIGQMMQCAIISGIDHVPMHEVAKSFGNDRVAAATEGYAGDFSRGGSWISGQYSNRFIQVLTPMSVVRASGANTESLTDGISTLPELTSAPQGQFVGEKEEAQLEGYSTGQKRLIAKELIAMWAMSESLVRSPSANASARVRESVLAQVAATEDLYFLRGQKSGAGPTGLRYQAHADNILTANGTVNVANIIGDLSKLETALANANVRGLRFGWAMAPRTMQYLADLRDNAGWVFPTLQDERPRLRRKPVYTTTQIPINLGGSTDESEIYLFDSSHLVIGDVPNMSFQSSNVAAYKDADGNLQAAFGKRQVISRLVLGTDIITEHDKAIAVLTEVDWGA